MTQPLRQRVSEMMVRVHLIPPDLAARQCEENLRHSLRESASVARRVHYKQPSIDREETI
jgi:hypothetical protein